MRSIDILKIKISDHFNFVKLIKFTVPSIVMMVFSSIYNVVDGFFVSNFTGKTQFAAVNLIMPFLMLLGVVGFMFGTGGNAIIAKTQGEGKTERANQIFTMLVTLTAIVGFILFVVGELTMPWIVKTLGATEEMYDYAVLYGRIICISVMPFTLQILFQSFLPTAGKPHIGLTITIIAGVTNIILDFLFVGIFKWGIVGAAAATVTGECIGGLAPVFYFLSKNSSTLKFCKFKFDFKVIGKACVNGSSELMTNVSTSIVNMMYNGQLMKFYGEDGVAAYGTIMYVNFVFVAAFIGYSIGSAPIVGYNYGSENHKELQNIFKKSIGIIFVFSVAITLASVLLAGAVAKIYVGYDEGLFNLTVKAFRLFSTSYLIIGFNIYGSAFFTALNNGLISAVISFLRTLLFQIVCVYVLPLIFGNGAIWLSITVAELLTLTVTLSMIFTQNGKYHYLPPLKSHTV